MILLFRTGTIKKIIVSQGIENIEYAAFCGTKNLSEIIIPKSVKVIGAYAFANCFSLNDIKILNKDISIANYCTFENIETLTIHVPWKEGEKQDNWVKNNIQVDYAK